MVEAPAPHQGLRVILAGDQAPQLHVVARDEGRELSDARDVAGARHTDAQHVSPRHPGTTVASILRSASAESLKPIAGSGRS